MNSDTAYQTISLQFSYNRHRGYPRGHTSREIFFSISQ